MYSRLRVHTKAEPAMPVKENFKPGRVVHACNLIRWEIQTRLIGKVACDWHA